MTCAARYARLKEEQRTVDSGGASMPAALAFGLVLNEWTPLTLVVVIFGITALSICKRLVLPYRMDLL